MNPSKTINGQRWPTRLAPSKSTCYVGNLPFNLTNNDIHKIFDTFGKIAKVTILRNKETRESKGVAFVNYVEKTSAITACEAVNGKTFFERKIKCVIATDNGRAGEFIKRKEYPDKSRCYECGESGHLSYVCPKNALGDRDPPPKKERRPKKRTKEEEIKTRIENKKRLKIMHADDEDAADVDDDTDVGEGEDPRLSSLSAVIELEANKYNKSYYNNNWHSSSSSNSTSVPNETLNSEPCSPKKKRIKQSSYFSDEDEEED